MLSRKERPDVDGLLSPTAIAQLVVLVGVSYLIGRWNPPFDDAWYLLVVLAVALRSRSGAAARARARAANGAARALGYAELRQLLGDQLPAWVLLPDVERSEWLNVALERFWVPLKLATGRTIMDRVQPILDAHRPSALSTFGLAGEEDFDLGEAPPLVVGVKAHRTENHREIVLDLDVQWVTRDTNIVFRAGLNVMSRAHRDGGAADDEPHARASSVDAAEQLEHDGGRARRGSSGAAGRPNNVLHRIVQEGRRALANPVNSMASLAIRATDVRIFGKLRLTFAPMVGAWPCFGALTIGFVTPPEVDLSLRAVGGMLDVMDLPIIQTGLEKLLRETLLRELMVFPNRIVVRLMDEDELNVLLRGDRAGVAAKRAVLDERAARAPRGVL